MDAEILIEKAPAAPWELRAAEALPTEPTDAKVPDPGRRVNYRIVPVSPLHIGPLVSRLGAQKEQIEALGERPREWIRLLVSQSRIAWTVLVDDRPVVIWGVKCTLSSAEADVWLAITDFAREHVRPLVKGTRAELDKLLETRAALNTVVPVTDERALRWCGFLGFKIIETFQAGTDGRVFHRLRKER